MVKRFIIKVLIYVTLELGTFLNFYSIKEVYDASLKFIQLNYFDLYDMTSTDELVEKYGNKIQKMQFVEDNYIDVYIVDKENDVSIIATYWDSEGGEVSFFRYILSDVNCHYWLRITINFIIVLVGLAIAYNIKE